MKIEFYSPHDEYGCFSNFSQHPVKLDGKTWKTSEHYFQAQKFVMAKDGQKHMNDVCNAKTPGVAARIGRDRKRPLRKDWESVKDEVMYRAVYAKFTQHEDLRQILLDTGTAVLAEHTEKDSYWGDGGDGRGRNQLGKTLMRVRDAIRRNQ